MFSTEVEEEEAKCEHLKRVFIGDDKEKFFQVEVQLPPWERQELIDFVRKNINMFAWSGYKAPRVDSDFICHRLNVNPSAILKKQHLGAHLRNILTLSRGKCQAQAGWGHKRGILPRVAGQHSRVKKENWEVANMCRLYGFK